MDSSRRGEGEGLSAVASNGHPVGKGGVKVGVAVTTRVVTVAVGAPTALGLAAEIPNADDAVGIGSSPFYIAGMVIVVIVLIITVPCDDGHAQGMMGVDNRGGVSVCIPVGNAEKEEELEGRMAQQGESKRHGEGKGDLKLLPP